MTRKMKIETFADLCAGIGGFRIGVERSGLKCVLTSEINSDCVTTYNKNFDEENDVSDITALNPQRMKDFDMLCAGFPCQPFSIAGKKMGLQDSRSNVLAKIIDIAQAKKPKIILLENVANFKSFGGGSLHQATQRAIMDLGYSVFSDILDSSRFGVPQQRKRLFIAAFRNDLGIDTFRFPVGENEKTSFRPFLAANDFSIPITDKWDQYIDLYCGRKTLDELTFEPPKTRLCLERADADINLHDCVFQMRSSGIRAVSIDKPLPTFAVSISGGGAMIPIYSKERRHLNLTEMKRLMGFPDSFTFPVSRTSAVKQLANAVTPQVIERILEKIISVLENGGEAPGQRSFPLLAQ